VGKGGDTTEGVKMVCDQFEASLSPSPSGTGDFPQVWAHEGRVQIALDPFWSTDGTHLGTYRVRPHHWAVLSAFEDIQRNAEAWFGSPAPSKWGPVHVAVGDQPDNIARVNSFTRECSDIQESLVPFHRLSSTTQKEEYVKSYHSAVVATPTFQEPKDFVYPIYKIFMGDVFKSQKHNVFQEVFDIIHAGSRKFEINQIVWRGADIPGNPIRQSIAEFGQTHGKISDLSPNGPFLSNVERARYKYQLLSLGGMGLSDCPSYEDRSYWALFMNRVVFQPQVTNSNGADLTPVTWHSKDLKLCQDLKVDAERGCHIVPVKADLSDLYEKYMLLEMNPETYNRIQKNLNTFARENLTPGRAYQYVFEHVMGGKATRSASDIAKSDFGENQEFRWEALQNNSCEDTNHVKLSN
jgi:hypothetical protein